MCQMLTVTLMATYCTGQLLRAAERQRLLGRPREEKSWDQINRLPFKRWHREFCRAHASHSCCCDYNRRRRARLIIDLLSCEAWLHFFSLSEADVDSQSLLLHRLYKTVIIQNVKEVNTAQNESAKYFLDCFVSKMPFTSSQSTTWYLQIVCFI